MPIMKGKDKRRIRGNIITLHNSSGGCSEVGITLFSQDKRQDKKKWPKVGPGEVQVGISKGFFIARAVRH